MSAHGDGAVVRLDAAELLATVPQLAEVDIQIQAHQFRSRPSSALGFDDIVELVATASALNTDGVVVVQGTDTIEETAYLIDLLWTQDAPIVVTGAMRNPSLAGADGPANLLAAVTVAASEQFRGLGALVAFNDEVHAARFVRKAHSTSPATFCSPNAGPIGQVLESVAIALTRVPRRPTYRVDRPITARIPVVPVVLGDSGELLDGLADRCDALVVAGMGGGHVPPQLAEPLGELARQVPVVLASRTGAGAVLSKTYGFAGSETDLLERGLIRAGLLDPYKARVLLQILVASRCDHAGMVQAFSTAT